jgi:phosphomannomutase
MEKKTLLLFDVDGTLTKPRLPVDLNMITLLQEIKKNKNIDLGFVGGSDYSKQIEQLKEENLDLFTWKFTENGLYSFHKNELIHTNKLVEFLGEENYKKIVNACLKCISEIDIPEKRGNFIELRNGMINISPIGRSCSQIERENFYEFDKENHIREKMIRNLKYELNDVNNLNLTFSIGGQISIDIFPKGWDKTYCLQFVEDKYESIYFFGDKTDTGGNDHEIYNDSRVKGYSVKSYEDTIKFLNELFANYI